MTPLTTTLSLLLGAAVAFAAPAERPKRGLAQVISQCNHGFAYTWDDGPYIHNTDLVNKFSSRNAHTTFFVNGDNYECIYDDVNVQRLRYAFEHGMQIASHTWSHADLTTITHAQIDVEIQRLDEAFIKILGVKPKFLRPPYGSINEDVANYIQQKHGKTIVLWDLDSGDSQGGNEQNSVDFYYHLAYDEPNTTPHLTLSHETLDWSANAALRDGTVDALANQGFPLLTVAECTNLPAYETIGGYGTRDSSWFCGGSWTPSTTTSAPTTTMTTTSSTTTSTSTSTSTSTTPTPSCKSTYISKPNDTCDSIETANNLVAGTIKAANSFLTCNDIWTGTPICVPDGPYKPPQNGAPGCTTQTYRNSAGETCSSIEAKFALPSGQVKQRNSYVTCTDIWAGTPLDICVPSLSPSDPQTCTQTYTSKPNDTCQTIAAAFGTTAQWIKAWNSFLNCSDIWTNTSVCVKH